MRPRPTEEEFAELKRKRDESVETMVAEICKKHGWPREEVHTHHSHSDECYCDCPNGPCQHIWDGPEWTDAEEGSEDFNCSSTTCSRCGAIALYHDLRFAP